MSENNGGPAFPSDEISLYSEAASALNRQHLGMTIRQYYAAHSHIGLDDANLSLQQRNTMGVLEFGVAALIAEMVRLRLEYADTMIAAESAQ